MQGLLSGCSPPAEPVVGPANALLRAFLLAVKKDARAALSRYVLPAEYIWAFV